MISYLVIPSITVILVKSLVKFAINLNFNNKPCLKDFLLLNMVTGIIAELLGGLATSYIIRSVPGTILGLTGIVLTGLFGIHYYRRRTLNRAPSPPGNAVVNHFRFRLDPDFLLKKSEQLTKQHGKILELPSLREEIPWRQGLSSCCDKENRDVLDIEEDPCCPPLCVKPLQSIENISEKPKFIYQRCVLTNFTRNLLIISDLGVAKDIIQSRDGKFRERPMLGWIDSVKTASKLGKPFDLWLAERKEIKRNYKTFSLERSSSDQLKKFDAIVSRTLKTLMSLPTDESPTLTRSDLMFLTTNTLMEYLCGKKFHSQNERFSRFVNKLDQLHENFVLNHVYLRGISEIVYHRFWFKKEYRERAKKAYDSADFIIKFLESDVGLIEMRETMREKYSDGSYPDDIGLNFAQILIKSHLENPEKISWDGCVKTIASLVSSASPMSNMIMSSLGYLSLDEASQDSIHDEISQKFGKNQNEFLSIEESMKLATVKVVLMETYRMVSSPPIFFTANEKTSVNGYDVRKGTRILVNIEQINHSKELWEEPETFNPERFLANSEENPQIPIVKKPSAYLPYNFGQKSHAMMSLLEHMASNFLANIVHRFMIDSNHSRQEMIKSGLGSYESIDMKNFFVVNLKRN